MYKSSCSVVQQPLSNTPCVFPKVEKKSLMEVAGSSNENNSTHENSILFASTLISFSPLLHFFVRNLLQILDLMFKTFRFSLDPRIGDGVKNPIFLRLIRVQRSIVFYWIFKSLQYTVTRWEQHNNIYTYSRYTVYIVIHVRKFNVPFNFSKRQISSCKFCQRNITSTIKCN